MKIRKKSQATQIFTSIIAIFVFALILFFGYKGIKDLIDKGKTVEAVQFKTNLEKEFERVRNAGFGSRIVYDNRNTFKAISGLRQICFFDSREDGDCDGGNAYGENTPIICDAFNSRAATKQNVFIEGDVTITGDIMVGNIEINKDADDGSTDDGVLCIKPTGPILCFSLENKGRNVFVDMFDCVTS